MADDSPPTTRTYVAVALAAASSTLAIGLTVAALVGYSSGTPGRAPAVPAPASAPAPSMPLPRATAAPAEPSVVLVPIERIEPAAANLPTVDPSSEFSGADLVASDDASDDDGEDEHHRHHRYDREDDDDD